MFFNNGDRENVSLFGEGTEYSNRLLEGIIFSEACKLPAEERIAFAESDEAQLLLERQVLNKKTLVRLSKNDDMARRQKMAAFQLAKEKKDPLWAKLVKNRVIERELIKKIVHKYNTQASRVARVSQQEYIKTARNSKYLPKPSTPKR